MVLFLRIDAARESQDAGIQCAIAVYALPALSGSEMKADVLSMDDVKHTPPGNLVSHICGNGHRKALEGVLQAGLKFPTLFIPSSGVSIDVLLGAPVGFFQQRYTRGMLLPRTFEVSHSVQAGKVLGSVHRQAVLVGESEDVVWQWVLWSSQSSAIR